MKVATCIGCGCDDGHACWNEVTELPCSWLRVDRGRGLGVCSSCPEHVSRWETGDMTFNVPIETDQAVAGRG